MIKTAIQLKAKVRNLSQGDSTKAQTYIRNFMMERFLERLSLSRYRDNLKLFISDSLYAPNMIRIELNAAGRAGGYRASVRVIAIRDLITHGPVKYAFAKLYHVPRQAFGHRSAVEHWAEAHVSIIITVIQRL